MSNCANFTRIVNNYKIWIISIHINFIIISQHPEVLQLFPMDLRWKLNNYIKHIHKYENCYVRTAQRFHALGNSQSKYMTVTVTEHSTYSEESLSLSIVHIVRSHCHNWVDSVLENSLPEIIGCKNYALSSLSGDFTELIMIAKYSMYSEESLSLSTVRIVKRTMVRNKYSTYSEEYDGTYWPQCV